MTFTSDTLSLIQVVVNPSCVFVYFITILTIVTERKTFACLHLDGEYYIYTAKLLTNNVHCQQVLNIYLVIMWLSV